MVVLAVDVRGDGAPDGYLAGSRRDHGPEAERNHCPHQVVQADTRLDPGPARLHVDVENLVQPGGDDHVAPGILGRVAIAASKAAGDHTPRSGGRDGSRQVGGAADGAHRGHRGGGATPPGNSASFGGSGRSMPRGAGAEWTGQLAYTPMANSTTHTTPSTCMVWSVNTNSSGLPPLPLSTRKV